MNLDDAITHACERVPGLVRGALLFLPEGFLLAGTRNASNLDLEPLIRSAARTLAPREAPSIHDETLDAVEYVFVIHDQLVVIQRGRRDPRLALAVVCTREHNIAFAMGTTRLAMRELEEVVDLSPWGL